MKRRDRKAADPNLSLPGLPQPASGQLEFLGRPVTADQLQRRGESLAAALLQTGLQEGDGLALLLPDSPGLLVASLAALRLGMRPHLLDPADPPEALARAIAGGASGLLLTFDLQVLLDRSLALPPLLPGLRIGVLRFSEELPFPHNLLMPLMRGNGIGQRPAHPAYFRLTSRPAGKGGALPHRPSAEPRLLFSDGEASLSGLLAESDAGTEPAETPPLHRRSGFARLLRALVEGGCYRIGGRGVSALSA